MLVARPMPFSILFLSIFMADAQENSTVSDEKDPSPGLRTEQEVPLPHYSVGPMNQQDYWRWVQFQILRERTGKSSVREE